MYLPDGGGDSLDKDRCYYCQHSKHGHGHMECAQCQVGIIACTFVIETTPCDYNLHLQGNSTTKTRVN